MAEQLAVVPEESTTGFTADHPRRNTYRNWIRKIAVSGAPIRWTLFPHFQSGHDGSSYSSDSGASNSNPSNKSGSGPAPVFAHVAEYEDHDLMRIARYMVREGYAQHMVQAFDDAFSAPAFTYGGSPDHALKNWFLELDVDWVLQIHDHHGLQRHLLQDKSASTPQDLVERWIRALAVIVATTTELVFAFHGTPAAALFAKASIAEMLAFVDVVVPVLKPEKLGAVLDMYICVSGAAYMFTPAVVSPEAQIIFNEIGRSLEREGNRLSVAISSTMEVRTLVEDDDSWDIEIPRGGGEVHRNTRFMVDCIASMGKARTSMKISAPNHNTGFLRDLIDDTIDNVKDLLLTKSELCSDPGLRYLFLLNNSYFLAQVCEPSISLDVELLSGHHQGLELTPECENYIDRYIEVSWQDVLSCLSSSNFHGPLRRWTNTSWLTKFHSAFHKTYMAQKFWKVPEPRVRSLLRDKIAKRVISGYRNYLKEHPELEKQVIGGINSPEAFEEMLVELFEG